MDFLKGEWVGGVFWTVKAFLCSLCLLAFFLHAAVADGLPYDQDGEPHGEFVLLSMNEDQFREVDTTRMLTLTKAQRALLGRLFAAVPERLEVVSSAFNDGRDEAGTNEVHCIWLRGRSIGVTYNADSGGRSPEEYSAEARFVSVADPDRLIISHDSKIFRKGKELTVGDVFRLIDELAQKARDVLVRNEEVRIPPCSLSFSLPPRGNPNYGATSASPAELLVAFTVYGAVKHVQVGATW